MADVAFDVEPRQPEAAVAVDDADLLAGARQLRRRREAGARAETAELSRIQPMPRPVDVQDARRERHDVAAVPDYGGVVVEKIAHLAH